MDDIQPGTEDACAMCGDLSFVRVEPFRACYLRPFCTRCGRRIPVRERSHTHGDREPAARGER